MMALLAGLLGAFTGPLMRYVAFTVGGLLAITGAHLMVENWKGNLRADGARQCDARWEKQIREEERAAASADARSARSLLDTERKTTEELHDRITQMQLEIDAVRDSSPGGDEHCLSDGVLDSLGKRQPGGKHTPSPKAGPARPAS